MTVFTVGHSNHPIEIFLRLLRLHRIEVIADVRSIPYSRYVPQFNKKNLQQALAEEGIEYLFYGAALGGRPRERRFYDEKGRLIHHRLMQEHSFQHGIRDLLVWAGTHRLALLCAEEDPRHCHRKSLIAKVLLERGVDVFHIRGTGYLEKEGDRAFLPDEA